MDKLIIILWIIKNANEYKNLMRVDHPDDEILWGGSNLFKDKYFVVCVAKLIGFREKMILEKL